MKRILTLWLIFLPVIVLPQNFLEQFTYRKQTAFFDFRFKSNSPQDGDIARFADGFVKLVNRGFFNANFDYPIRVLVLPDRAQFKELLVHQFQIDDPPNFGIYVPSFKLFATYQDSGIGTFAHEILHPLVERNLNDRPLWTKEGIPTFFEKFYAYWKHDELIVFWGFQNPWRIAQIGTNLTQLNLRAIISDPEPSTKFSAVERDESNLRMASVFLWNQGRFKRFLNLIVTHNKAGFPSYFEAAMEMPIERIQPLWQSYLNDVADQRANILRLPVSTICNDEAAFQKFVKVNDISLEQPKQRD
jgi:hypothetical protein